MVHFLMAMSVNWNLFVVLCLAAKKYNPTKFILVFVKGTATPFKGLPFEVQESPSQTVVQGSNMKLKKHG